MAEKKTAKSSRSAPTREERLKAALKANMGRRKAQAKARADQDGGDDGTAGNPKE
ncbi:hypothetical protein [Phaeobacter porticola]|uniref:hypothetical protein n=1 Tax=Phaeobacter porticola TaxID=1844006 RepID=UPI000ACC873B|nr:hypothetical protein [Phaeobacter porticola]